jgi:Domain of unknown function (DUF5658)
MIEILVIINITLQIADAYITILVIRQGGRELNPVLVWLADRLKSVTNERWAWLVVKFVAASSAIVVLYAMGELIALFILAIFQAYMVHHNYGQIK